MESSVVKRISKYTFNSFYCSGKYYTLDAMTQVNHPTYCRYVNNDSELSQQERDYNYRLSDVTKFMELDISELRMQLKREQEKSIALANKMDRIKKSIWEYTLFKFDI